MATTLTSKGKRSVGKLRGAERKTFHQGAFWTPVAIAQRLHVMLGLHRAEGLTILDNAAGTGRLLEGLEQHRCYAVEIDEEAVKSLEDAQPKTHTHHGSFLEVRAERFSVALLNPPFNLVQDHERIRALGIGNHGPAGVGTRTMSQYASIALALNGAAVVVAIAPRGTFSETNEASQSFLAKYGDRLAAVLDLPANAFNCEGTNVSTEVGVFGPTGHGFGKPIRTEFWSEEAEESLTAVRDCLSELDIQEPVFGSAHQMPAWLAALPESALGRVRLTRKGRRLVVKPDSVQTYYQALDVLAGRITGKEKKAPWRIEERSRRFGLDLEAYLVQDDPLAALQNAIGDLQAAGLTVDLDSCFFNWFRRRVRQVKRDLVPMRHWVLLSGREQLRYWLMKRGTVSAIAKVTKYGLASGATYSVDWTDDRGHAWRGEDGCQHPATFEELVTLFTFPEGPDISRGREWVLLHKGLEEARPELHLHLSREIERLGIDRWIYKFSAKDLIELAGRTSGLYNAFMSLGKTRFAMALIKLIRPKHGLIVVKRRHIREFVEQYQDLGFPDADLQIIDHPAKLQDLRAINIVSYSKLISSVNGGKRTYADALRHRVGVVVCDEAHDLSNPDSHRSRAVETLRAKRLYEMTGYALRGYARNIHNLARLVAGDGTPRNPYGRHVPYLEKMLLHAACVARPATQVFAEHFVDIRSASSQFSETLASGFRIGERPVLKDVTRFRRYIDSFVLRRLKNEPEVAAEIPEVHIDEETVYVEPASEQAALYNHYLGGYADWFTTEVETHGRIRHFVEAKSRLALLHWSSSFPQSKRCDDLFKARLTELQQRLLADIDRIMADTDDKVLVVFDNPSHVEFFAGHLRARGHAVGVAHGRQAIEARESVIYDDFRDGTARILACSAEIISEAYNLHAANWVLHGDSYWVPYLKAQINMRIARPQQKKVCHVRHYVPRGLLNEYKEEFSRLKDRVIAAGVDYDESPEGAEVPSMYEVFRDLVERYKVQIRPESVRDVA